MGWAIKHEAALNAAKELQAALGLSAQVRATTAEKPMVVATMTALDARNLAETIRAASDG